MQARTHLAANPALCGRVTTLAEGEAEVVLETTREMVVDAEGLVHGGFIFGLADYAAMLAINHPLVVLAGAESRFVRPVAVGSQVRAKATTAQTRGRKHEVRVEAAVGEQIVFEGTFTCVVLERHVLEGVGSK